jgi:hypothetical protein
VRTSGNALQVHDLFRHMLPVLSLTQRHIGVADIFIVTRVGTAIKAAPLTRNASLIKGRRAAVQYPNGNMGDGYE